jgi:hypothetical protein
MGLVMARYVIEVPQVATMTPSELAALVGPTIDRYLVGDIGRPGTAPGATAARATGSP